MLYILKRNYQNLQMKPEGDFKNQLQDVANVSIQ